jgi:hypothetical protein
MTIDRASVLTAALLFVGTFATLFLMGPIRVSVYDEGLILTGAFRIMAGEAPSADFYTPYGPAQFYMVAAVFEVFGRSVTAGRLYDAVVAAAILPAAWQVLKGQLARAYVVAALGLVIVLLHLFLKPLYPITPAILLVIVGCSFTIRALTARESLLAFMPVALVVGVITAFRYDLMLIAILAFGTPIAAVFASQVHAGVRRPAEAAKRFLGAAGLVVLVVAGVLGALYAAGILEPALGDLLTYNSGNYVAMRSWPFPGLRQVWWDIPNGFAIYLPPAAVLLGLITCAVNVRTAWRVPGQMVSPAPEKRLVTMIVLISVTLACYLKGLVRTQGIHTLLADVPAVLLVFLCVECLEARVLAGRGDRSRAVARALVVAGAILVAATCFFLGSKHKRVIANFSAPEGPPVPEALSPFRSHPEQLAAARYVVETTGPEERILSATGRHDKIYVNDNLFYYLAKRLPGTRWHHYDPGVQTSEAVQREMVRELEANDVAVIVRDTRWDDMREPNKSALSSGVTVLDDYIARTYREEWRLQSITVLRRID